MFKLSCNVGQLMTTLRVRHSNMISILGDTHMSKRLPRVIDPNIVSCVLRCFHKFKDYVLQNFDPFLSSRFPRFMCSGFKGVCHEIVTTIFFMIRTHLTNRLKYF